MDKSLRERRRETQRVAEQAAASIHKRRTRRLPRPLVILLGCLAGACAGYVGSWLRTRGLGEIHGWFALAGFVVGGLATAWFGDRAARLLNFIAPGG